MKYLSWFLGIIIVSGCITEYSTALVSEEEYLVYLMVNTEYPVVFEFITAKPGLLPEETDNGKKNGSIEQAAIPIKIPTFALSNKTIPIPQKVTDEFLKEYSLLEGSKCTIAEHRGSPCAGNVMNCILVEASQIEMLFSSNNPWNEFYNKYPGVIGIIKFSRVYFNYMKDKAVVYRESCNGPRSGKGELFFLEKKNDSWLIKEIKTIWVS